MSSPKKIVILGGGGDAAVLAETLSRMAGQWALLGFLDDGLAQGSKVHGCGVLGGLEDWQGLPGNVLLVSALHKVKQMERRSARIEALEIPRQRWASVIDPTAVVARDARIGHGVYLGPHVVVQPGAAVGDHATIRACANLGHDAQVGDYCYLGPNSTLCGRAVMERGSHMGPNACIVDGQRLGEYSVLGVCSAGTKHLPARGIYFGVPAVRVGTVAP